MSISSAIKFITSSEHCLLIADLQLPGMDKLEMIRVLRIMPFDPIIAIADHLESNELGNLYHFGADIHMEKPIDARICAAQATALIDGRQIDLTQKQFDLLLYLARHRHQAFNAKQLSAQIWNDLFDLGGENTVMVHINTL